MRFLTRNWHLKLGAVALATILYTGFVFSGSFDERTIEVPVGRAGQPECCFLLTDELGTVAVRHRVAVEVGDVTADAFAATVDLSQYDLDAIGEPQTVPVEVRSVAEDVTVLGWSPREVTVVLDRLIEKEVPIEVDRGSLPDTLTLEEPEVTVGGDTLVGVTAVGPSSAVNEVVAALARVTIDPSGIDINQPVDLVPVDLDGEEVTSVDLEPETVTVVIEVRTVETTRSLPVRPSLTGTAAAGYALETVAVDPPTVRLRGTEEALAGIDEVVTEPIDLAGVTETQEVEVALVIPEELGLAPNEQGNVTVTASIVATTATRTMAVAVQCDGAGDNACLPSLGQVAVTLSGAASDLGALDPIDISALVDVAGVAPGTVTIPVEVALPDGVTLVAIAPGSVQVTIVAPATPTPVPTPAP